MFPTIRSLLYWVNYQTPPFLNLVLTAGFHAALTFTAGFVGLDRDFAVGYTVFKEGQAPLMAFLNGKPVAGVYEPNAKQKELGWTRAWVLADSIADAAGPWLAVLARAIFF